jgi:hypothetical protein
MYSACCASDIAMAFDDCTAYPATPQQARESMQRSMRWALRSYDHYYPRSSRRRGICLASCRAACTRICGSSRSRRCRSANFRLRDRRSGGGRAGGGAAERVLELLTPRLPALRPRYLMGVGYPQDIVAAVARGGRHVRLRDADPPCAQRSPVHIRRHHQYPQCAAPARHRTDRPGVQLLDLQPLFACLSAPPGSLQRNPGVRLATLHNLHFYLQLMRQIRAAIAAASLRSSRPVLWLCRGGRARLWHNARPLRRCRGGPKRAEGLRQRPYRGLGSHNPGSNNTEASMSLLDQRRVRATTGGGLGGGGMGQIIILVVFVGGVLFPADPSAAKAHEGSAGDALAPGQRAMKS